MSKTCKPRRHCRIRKGIVRIVENEEVVVNVVKVKHVNMTATIKKCTNWIVRNLGIVGNVDIIEHCRKCKKYMEIVDHLYIVNK